MGRNKIISARNSGGLHKKSSEEILKRGHIENML